MHSILYGKEIDMNGYVLTLFDNEIGMNGYR